MSLQHNYTVGHVTKSVVYVITMTNNSLRGTTQYVDQFHSAISVMWILWKRSNLWHRKNSLSNLQL